MIALVLAAVLSASPVADAAERADWPEVSRLLASQADPNLPQADGATALHWAAQHDAEQAVTGLLAAGANSRAVNRYGVPPLALACVNGNETIVRALLESGASPNTILPGGESVLMTAARTGRVGVLKALMERGAYLDDPDRKGQTALMWAAAEGNTEAVELLLQQGADADKRLKSGFTAFLFAVRQGKLETVRALLKAGADSNQALSGGASALLLAVENAHFELALELVRAGANPNDKRGGVTPLHMLSRVRKPARGDDPSGQPPPDGSGNVTSLDFARQIVALGANPNLALTEGEPGRGRLRFKGSTPFMLAAKTADLELMRVLVELGADPLRPNADGTTPFMAAAGYGCLAPTEEAGTESECLQAVEYLLSLGADVNTVDANGETAMHGAAYKSLPRMVRWLNGHGAKIEIWNRKNKAGWTPVSIAEGFRPGNFKPSVETLEALHEVMRSAGRVPPPPTPRTE